MFEGVVMPEIYLAEALGGVGKPVLRVHTAGSVGGSTAIVAATHVASGVVQAGADGRRSKSNRNPTPTGRCRRPCPFARTSIRGAGGMFAPILREYIHRNRCPADVGCMVALKDRKHALRNPRAHLQIKDISLEMVKNSPMLWEPIRFLETCPSSDGACAMVLCSEDLAARSARPPAWIHAMAMRSEPGILPLA